MSTLRLHQINQKLDICFGYDDDDPKHPILKTAAVAGGLGAAGYGGYKAHKAIRAHQGVMNADMLPGIGKTTYAGAAREAIGGAATKAASTGKGWLEALLSKIRGARALQSRQERLVELNSQLDRVIGFTTADERYKHQTPENNMLRGVGMGLLGGSWPGAIAGAQDAAKFRKEGVVYRKRDAFGNALGGAAIGGAVGAGAFVGGLHRLRHGSTIAGIGSIGVGYGAQRLLAGHTLNKRKAIYADKG